ncbi:MAG: GDP-mannose 4,6-dehydratase [Cyanobacteria bacterium]|nr:GDP-mannose 4,6-dehydratase [Cyanobacteriota bacterium]
MIVDKTPYAGKTYLVTGGAGFIGSHLTRALLERDAQVLVLDEFNDFYDPAIKEGNIKPFLDSDWGRSGQFQLHRVDLRNAQAVESVIKGLSPSELASFRAGGFVHLAARAGVRPSLTQPHLYLETNVTATLHLAELARQYQVPKFVFASSSSVYGDSPETVPFHEKQDISKPISPYASTKAMGESLLHTYSHLHGLQVVCLRFFTVYGPSQRPDLAIHKFTRLIDQGKSIPVFGDGTTRRDYTYIDDIIQGVLGAIAYDKTSYEIINLGESQTTSLSELISAIENALGKKAIQDPQPLQPGDVSITYADITKAKKLLGYNPQTKVAEGIPKFVEWYHQYYQSTPVSGSALGSISGVC